MAFLALPGIFSGVVPTILIIADPWRGDGYVFGLIPFGLGLATLLRCIREFYTSGKGTLAPWAPPTRLVITGLYCYVRNPMYIGVLMIISGLSLVFGSPILLGYLCFAMFIFHLQVVFYEEMRLRQRFEDEWHRYTEAVPRWFPRIFSEHNK